MKPFAFLQGSSGPPAFDPRTLGLKGWWRVPYAGAPLTPADPTNTLGNLVQYTAGPTPSVGAALNGFNTMGFSTGGLRRLATAQSSSQFASSGLMTLGLLFRCTTFVAAAGIWYSEAPLVTANLGDCGFAVSAGGIRGGNGGAGNTPYVPYTLNTWAAAWFRVSPSPATGTIEVRVSQPSGTVDSAPVQIAGLSIDGSWKIGTNWNEDPPASFAGEIAEVIATDVKLSSGDLVNMNSYFNSRYAVGLT